MIPRTFLIAALLAACACGSAMRTTIENHGSSVEIHALCGDAMYQTSLGSAGIVEWAPTANSCTLAIRGDGAGRRLTIRNSCLHAHGCAINVRLPGQSSTRLAGTGQVEIVGELATAGGS